MRLLIVAFYFPPAGGGGVQRTLKFCKFLPEFGVDVHVLAPDDPKWFARDDDLLSSVPAGTTVHRARFFGPRSSLLQEARSGRSGLRRAAVEARYAYERALVPDKVAPWIATAAPVGARVVRREGIDVIMSTSPPGSVHLVAEAVAAASRKPFVADFRDSWLDSPHRTYDRVSVRAKRRLVAGMARSVVTRAAALTAATGSIAQELAAIHASAAHKTTVIENGADFDDFEGLRRTNGDRFTIVHAGSFFGQRSPRPFLLGLQRLLARRPELHGKVAARFVGTLRQSDRQWAQQLGIDGAWEELGFLPYRDSVGEQRAADALLLLIPNADGRGDTVLSGKVFEYIASRRPILASVPPAGAAANLLRSLGAAEVVGPEDSDAIASALERMVDRWSNGAGLPDAEYGRDVLERLSRRSRANDLAEVLRRVAK